MTALAWLVVVVVGLVAGALGLLWGCLMGTAARADLRSDLEEAERRARAALALRDDALRQRDIYLALWREATRALPEATQAADRLVARARGAGPPTTGDCIPERQG